MSPALDNLHERLLFIVGWIRHADTKATAELSGAAALSGVAAAQMNNAETSAAVLLGISLVISLFAGGHAGAALAPRAKSSEDNRRSTLYFVPIAETTSADELLTRFLGQSKDDVIRDYVHQIRELSRIARDKSKYNNRAVRGLAVAALLLAIGLVVKGVN